MNNHIICNVDTDSIMIAKQDQTPWTKEEQQLFLQELNRQFPEMINWAHDGMYKSVLIIASKNYALLPEDKPKIKIKGSSLKDQKKEIALREMVNKIIETMLKGDPTTVVDIYKQYVKEAVNVTDISRWAQKKSITEPVLKCRGYEKYTKEQLAAKEIRANETNIWDAVKNEELVQQGDKVYIYPAVLSKETVMEPVIRKNRKTGEMEHKGEKAKEHITYGLKMTKYWDKQDHDVDQLVKRVYDTIKIFSTVLDMNEFINYSLVKNKELWKTL
jgi:DNA polymerase elongation subunit (family B)